MAQKILLFYGGVSPEHNVSCISAKFISEVLNAENYFVLPIYVNRTGCWHLQKRIFLKPEKHVSNLCFFSCEDQKKLITSDGQIYKFDIAFPIIHGRMGEDGNIQGMLTFLNIPYVGAGVLTSSTCMDKYYAKTLMKDSKFPIVPYFRIDQSDWLNRPDQIKNEVLNKFMFPLFIKPCNMGSSIGASKAQSVEDFNNAVNTALQYDTQVLVEKFINARELEISIMGNHPNYKITDIGEILFKSEFYSYAVKYTSQEAELQIPAKITLKQKNFIQNMTTAVFRMLHGDGFARIDFFLEKTSNQIYINEINTLPGFTPISMFPKLWEHTGIKPNILISNLVQLGLERHEARKKLKSVY